LLQRVVQFQNGSAHAIDETVAVGDDTMIKQQPTFKRLSMQIHDAPLVINKTLA